MNLLLKRHSVFDSKFLTPIFLQNKVNSVVPNTPPLTKNG